MSTASITTFPAQLWQWWLQELRSLAPLADQRKLANRKCRREIFINGQSASLHEKQRLSSPLQAPVSVIPSESLPEFLTMMKHADQVILSLGDDEFFLRRSVLPMQALPRAQQILELELRQVLPMNSSDIFTGWYQLGQCQNGQAALEQVAVKRSRIEELVAILRNGGVRTSAISFRKDDGSALPIVMDTQGQMLGLSANKRWQKISLVAVASVLCMFAAFVWVAFHRQNADLAALTAAGNEMRAKAVEVRKSIESAKTANARIAQLTQLRADAPNLVTVWESLAKLIPDSAWITNFTLGGKTINLDGEAADAESLLKLLEASNLFKNVRFTAPVTKNPGAGLAHYAIAMDFEELP